MKDILNVEHLNKSYGDFSLTDVFHCRRAV